MVDTTHIGGAERMAINFVNDLSKLDGFKLSLIISRSEGTGSSFILPGVNVECLQKKRAIDLAAFRRFIAFLKSNKIQLIHAHTNSVYWALAAKTLFLPNLFVIWHDHYGLRADSGRKFNFRASIWSRMLDGYIGVSALVMDWAHQYIKLSHDKMTFLPNYPELQQPSQNAIDRYKSKSGSPTFLCLGNYRVEKEQLLLVEAFKRVLQQLPDAKLWLAGKDIQPEYKASVLHMINMLQLQNHIVDWGECTDVASLMEAADIGVFASRFEGLPVSLLEFGLMGKPVVATEVGEIPKVLGFGKWGGLVPSLQMDALANAMVEIGKDKAQQIAWGKDFHHSVQVHYSKSAVIDQLATFYKIAFRSI
ncbi:MAG TPA: glycosyltransferase family 4 protein [Phnomibacter sp.]|nr:glycosyltransferase family 4 protein [Phnomibacter sp.]